MIISSVPLFGLLPHWFGSVSLWKILSFDPAASLRYQRDDQSCLIDQHAVSLVPQGR